MGKWFGGVLLLAWMGMHSATACETLLSQFSYRYDDSTQKTYASNGYNQQEVQLSKDYKEVVQTQGLDRVLRFGSDGQHAYYFEKPIIGANDYASLTPILNGSMMESHRYGWRYYQDRTAFYAAEDTGSQVVLHRLAPRKSDALRLELTTERRLVQGILIVGDLAFSEQQKLPVQGSRVKTQHVQDDFYVVSDGKATYAPIPLAHNEVDEWQTWYGKLGWVKIANLPELQILGSIENAHFECGATQYLYDVIYDVKGQVAVNQNLTNIVSPSRSSGQNTSAVNPFLSAPATPSIRPPADRDELLFNFTPYLFRYRLIPTLMANQAGIAIKPDVQSSLYSDRYQLFLNGREYELKGY